MTKSLLSTFVFLLVSLLPLQAQNFSAQEVRSIIVASQKYPDLQDAGSAHYKAFQKLLGQSLKAESRVFQSSNWPMQIAEKSRERLPALQRGRRTVGRTKIEKYEDAIDDMLKSKNPRVREFAQLEQAAYEAELEGDDETAAKIREKQAELQALGRIEALLRQLENDIWRLQQQLNQRR